MIPPLCGAPSLPCHRSLPVLTSRACSQPRASGTKRRPPAVESRIASIDVTVLLVPGRILEREGGADIELRLGLRDLRGLRDLEVHAPFIAYLVVEPGLRVIRAGIPTDAAVDCRAKVLLLARRD